MAKGLCEVIGLVAFGLMAISALTASFGPFGFIIALILLKAFDEQRKKKGC